MRGDDSAFSEGRGCYTAMRVSDGRPRFIDRHAQRLVQNAKALRIGELDEARLRRAFVELAAAAFPDGEGALRFQASRDGEGEVHVVGVPRPLGTESSTWSAIVAPFSHEGFTPYGGRKVSSRLLHALASEAASDAGVDEAILFDTAGRMVEGSRCNLFVSSATGELATPPTERGAVSGIARGVILERVTRVAEVDITRVDLSRARELIGVNAVRGACAITSLDGQPVGDGQPGECARRLAEALAKD